MKQNRWQSKLLWVAMLAQVIRIVSRFIPGMVDDVQLIGDVAITMLTIAGIINDPTTKGQW